MPPSRLEIILALNNQAFKRGLNAAGQAVKKMPGNIGPALRQTKNHFQQNIASVRQYNQELKKTSQEMSSFKRFALGALSIGATVYYANQVRVIADEYQNLSARLKLVTDGAEDFAAVQEGLYRISQETGTVYANNADSYTKMAFSLKEMGASSKETLDITELVNKSLTINGSNTAMASSFMLQFSQAMGSGVLQGDEFRAMLESNSYFASQLAKALDTDIAGLRQMSKNGELTAEKLRSAFPKMANEINAAFEKIPPTTSRAMTVLQNSFYRIIDDANKASNGTGNIAKEIIELAQTIDQNREGIISLFSAIISGASKTIGALANIGQSLAGWEAVGDGRLSFFEFATMDAKELNQWLKKNVQEVKNQESAFDKVTSSSKKSATEQASAQKKATDEMKKAYKDYANEVKRLQDDIAGRERSLAEQLREMDRGAMNAPSAWRDRRAQAEEFAASARKAEAAATAAFEAGDESTGKKKYEEALSYYDKARDAAAELNTEVSYGGKVILSQAQALEKARPLVEKYGKAGIDTQKKFEEAIKKAADALNEQSGGTLADEMPDVAKAFGDVKEQAVDLTAQSKLMDIAWKAAWDEMLKNGKATIAQLDGRIVQLTRDRHMKIYITEVTKKALGGLIGSAQRMAAGGAVAFRNMLSGGHFPGFGGGDHRHVIAEDGEYMFDKYRSRDLGLPALRALHAGKYREFIAMVMDRFDINPNEIISSLGQRMSLGGEVGRISLPSLPSPQLLAAGGPVTGNAEPAVAGRYVLELAMPGASQPVRAYMNDREMFERFVREAERRKRLSS